MRGFIIILLLVLGVLGFAGYAALGESGPIGWLNAAQASQDGRYSRSISALLLLLGIALIALAVLYGVAFFRNMLPARPVQAAPKPSPAPGPTPSAAATAAAAPKAPTPAPSGRRLGLTVWASCIALTWLCVFAWHGWDWHLRRADAVSTYLPLPLSRGVEPVRPEDGSHLALQGGLLWDHALTRRTTNGGGAPDAIFVPVAAADWRQGDPVHFVAKFGSTQQVYDLQRSAGDASAAVLVRVDGVVPTVTRPVFERRGVQVADNAVLVTAVASQAGRPTQAEPAFDWASANLIGGIVSGCLTFPFLVAVLGLKREAWASRRREAREMRQNR